MVTRLSLSYYPWITQSISGDELSRAISAFADLLLTELRGSLGNDVQLEVLKEMDVADQMKEIKTIPSGSLNGKVGLLNPVGYALAHRDMPPVMAIAVIRRKLGAAVGPTYKAQIYTNRKTAIRSIEKVRGRSMAFGSPQSTSNFLVPANMLWKAGIHPANGFNKVEFTGGHDKAASAVYEGRLEVGAGHDGAISDLANRPGYGDADQVLVNLAWSEPIPSDPVVAHIPADELREAVTQALLRVAKPGEPDSDGNQSVNRFLGTKEGFEAISPEAYVPLLDLMLPLGLRPDDLLRKI